MSGVWWSCQILIRRVSNNMAQSKQLTEIKAALQDAREDKAQECGCRGISASVVRASLHKLGLLDSAFVPGTLPWRDCLTPAGELLLELLERRTYPVYISATQVNEGDLVYSTRVPQICKCGAWIWSSERKVWIRTRPGTDPLKHAEVGVSIPVLDCGECGDICRDDGTTTSQQTAPETAPAVPVTCKCGLWKWDAADQSWKSYGKTPRKGPRCRRCNSLCNADGTVAKCGSARPFYLSHLHELVALEDQSSSMKPDTKRWRLAVADEILKLREAVSQPEGG